MAETPQTFASKTAILELMKRAPAIPRSELAAAVARQLDNPPPEDIELALDELKVEGLLRSELVNGVERLSLGA